MDSKESVGKSGLEVSIQKTSRKEGCKSGVMVGNKKKFILHSSIKPGYEIMASRERDSIDPRNQNKKIPVTTRVLGIKEIEENVFEVETETSFYEVKLHKN